MAKTTVPQYLSATTSIIDSGDATAITIDGSENVAIGGGTNHDGAALLVSHGDSGVTTFSDNADELVIENSTNAGISILTPSNASGSIIFGDSDDDDIGKIVYSHNDNSLTFTATTTATSGNTTVGGTLTIPDGSTSAPTLTNDGDSNTGIYFPADDQIGLVVGGSRKLLVNSSGLTVNNGSLDVDGGITIDNITIDGTEIDLSSGDLTVDVAGGIILDADDSGTISFKDGGTRYGLVQKATNDFEIKSMVDDGDILFKGLDDSSTITALSLDMSDAGTATFNHDIKLGDNGKAIFGAGSDLKIYHDGSSSIIEDSGTGHLRLHAGSLRIRNSANTEAMISADENGAVELYYDDSAKLATASGGVSVTGTLTASSHIILPATSRLYLDGSGDTFIEETIANTVTITTGNSERMRIDASGDVGIGGGVAPSSYNSNTRNLVIRDAGSGGITISTGASSTGYLAFNDGVDTTIEGLIAYNQSNDVMSFRTASTDDRLVIDGSGNVGIGTTSPSAPLMFGKSVYGDFDAENFYRIKFEDAGGVHNDVGIGQTASGSMGFNTTASGSFIFNDGTNGNILSLSNGAANFDGTISVGGTSSRTLGPVTGSYGTLQVSGSGAGGYEGLAIDGRVVMMHDGGSIFGIYNDVDDEWLARHDLNGATMLYYDGSEKFKTSSTGAHITGKLGIGTTSPSQKLHVHNATNGTDVTSLIQNAGTGAGDTATLNIQTAHASGDPKVRLQVSGYEHWDLFVDNSDNDSFKIYQQSDTRMAIKGASVGFGTDSPECNLHVAAANPNNTADAIFYVSKTGANDFTAKFGSGADDYGLHIRGTGSYSWSVYDHSAGAYRGRLTFGGDLYLQNTTVNSISDRRLKKKIVDANSQWNDIKALRWRNFEWKEEHLDGTYLGLIADEVESVSPNLVEISAQPKEDIDAGIEDPEHKAVKYSIVWMKAMKALQEAQERIETLEAKVQALESS